MNITEKYALQDTASKVMADEFKDTKAEMKEFLREVESLSGTPRAGVTIGDYRVEVTIVEGSESPDGSGDEFMDFLESKGYAIRTPDPAWKERVFLSGSKVVWADTGEVVPGAFAKRTAAYPKVSSVKRNGKAVKRADLGGLLAAARDEGLIGGELPLLGGE